VDILRAKTGQTLDKPNFNLFINLSRTTESDRIFNRVGTGMKDIMSREIKKERNVHHANKRHYFAAKLPNNETNSCWRRKGKRWLTGRRDAILIMYQAAMLVPHPPMASLLILVIRKWHCSKLAFYWLTSAYLGKYFFAEDLLIEKLITSRYLSKESFSLSWQAITIHQHVKLKTWLLCRHEINPWKIIYIDFKQNKWVIYRSCDSLLW